MQLNKALACQELLHLFCVCFLSEGIYLTVHMWRPTNLFLMHIFFSS